MTAYKCLQSGIEVVKPGARYRDIGEEVTKTANKRECSVVKSYCGHGIGTFLPLRAERAALREEQSRGDDERGTRVHDRTDDQRGRLEGPHVAGRVDGGDQGRKPLGAVRAHHGRHRRRRRVPHRQNRDVAEGVPVDGRGERPEDLVRGGTPRCDGNTTRYTRRPREREETPRNEEGSRPSATRLLFFRLSWRVPSKVRVFVTASPTPSPAGPAATTAAMAASMGAPSPSSARASRA